MPFPRQSDSIRVHFPEAIFMRSLWLLLVVCAATAVQSSQAQDQMAAIRAACTEDAQKLCAGVQPGGGRVLACLKEHKDSLSDRCKQAAGLAAKPSSSSAPSAASSPAASSRSVARAERSGCGRPGQTGRRTQNFYGQRRLGQSHGKVRGTRDHRYRTSRNARSNHSRARKMALRQQDRMALWLGRVPAFLFLSIGKS